MKFARLSLILLGVILGLGVVLAGIALLPGVQRWALLRAARDVPGLKLGVGRVSAGFSGVVLEHVEAETHRVVVKLERLDADFSLLAFLFGRKLDVSRLVVTGLDLDASHLARSRAGAAAAGAPAAAPGLLAKVQLPFDLTLGDAHVAGRALFPGAAGQPPLTAEYAITGGKLAVGQEGALQLDATVHNAAAAATVTALHLQAGLRATLTAQRTFAKVALTTVVDATGPALTGGGTQLKMSAELFRSSAGENYDVAVDTLIHGAAENMLKLQAQLPAGTAQYAGDWQLNARAAQLRPFALGAALPDFDATGSGKFAFDPVAASASLQGALHGQVTRLESLDPAWRALGPLKVDASFDGGRQGGVVQLNQFKAVVAGAQPVFDAQLTAPVRYDLAKHQLLAATQPSAGLLRVNVAALPMDWVRPFVTAADVSGGLITGQFDVARVAGSDTAATVRGQVQLGDLNIVRAGRPLAMHAGITLRMEATLAGNGVDAPVLELVVRTPEGDALRLTGNFSTRIEAHPPVSAALTFTASSPRLFARWLPGAPVTAQGELTAAWREGRVEVKSGRLQVAQGTGQSLLLDAGLLQPFGVDFATHAVTPRDASQPVAKIALGRLPLAVLPVAGPDASIGGFVEQGEFEISAPAGKVAVRALKPLQLTDVSLTQNRRVALRGLAIEVSPTLEYAGPGDFRVQSGDVTVRTDEKALLLGLKADAAATPGQDTQATITFTLEVPALATQPLFADAQAVSAGRATGEIRAALGARRQLEARFTLNGLVEAETGHTLPVANLSFRAVAQPGGALSVQAPVLLDNAGRRSDLNFALELTPLGRGYSVDGKLTGQQVELEDALGVLGVFLASAAPDDGAKPAVAGGAPDTEAAWSRFSGQLALDVKAVTYGKDWTMSGLNGAIAIEPARLALNPLAASFSETSRLAAKVELRFTGGALPYRLTGDCALNDFDVGRLFKAIEPARPPTIEGLFSVSGQLAGNGETPLRALDRVHGDFQLTGRQGVFRGLQRTGSKVSMTSKAVELGASVLGSILGTEKATKTAEKVAGQAYFVDQLAQGLNELKYDLLSVKLSRDERLNMDLEEIGLVSPELRLTGRGEVNYVAGKSLLEQPLTASLNLAARGKTEELLGKIKVLDGTKDDLGYAKTKEPVTLAGTLGKPDPTAFFTRIASAKIPDLLDPGQ